MAILLGVRFAKECLILLNIAPKSKVGLFLLQADLVMVVHHYSQGNIAMKAQKARTTIAAIKLPET